MQDAIDFLSRFTSQRQEANLRLERLLGDSPALLNSKGNDFFHRGFDYVKSLGISVEECYRDMLRRIFNASTTGKIVVQFLKGCDGELSLQVGDHDVFGVINVGDAPKLIKLLETDSLLVTGEKEIASSPHGMRNEPPTSPKVQLANEIKSHQTRLKDTNLKLESFIVTETPYVQPRLADAGWTKEVCKKCHVLFMEEVGYVEELFS